MSGFDKLVGSAPVNKQASLSMSKGVQYVPDKKIVNFHSEIRPPLIKISHREEDLAGIRFGRFTVIGKFSKGEGGKTAMWACRCDCGRYSARKRKSVLNPNNTEDCCEECRQLKYLQRRDRELRTTGEPR